MSENPPVYPPLQPDELKRNLTIAQPDTDQSLPHLGIVGDTYTITVSGDETDGRFCVIDMHIPPGGGPGPHRHDFEETTQSTSPRTLHTNSTMRLQAQPGFSASVRRQARKSFSWSSA